MEAPNSTNGSFREFGKATLVRGQEPRGIEPETKKSLRVRSSPTCTLSQNGYGEALILRFGSPRKGCGRYDIYNICYEAGALDANQTRTRREAGGLDANHS